MLGERCCANPKLKAVDGDIDHTVFLLFIPNTAEVAYYELSQRFKKYSNGWKIKRFSNLVISDRRGTACDS